MSRLCLICVRLVSGLVCRVTRGDVDEGDLYDPRPPAFKTANAFCDEYTPLAYVIEPIVRTSSVYTLTARTGAGKTALSVIAALAVVTGRREILGMDVEKGRVAYLAFENPDDVRMRLMVAAYTLSIDLAELSSQFVILDARAGPEAIATELRIMAAREGNFSLVIVDTFAAAFDGSDVNDNVETGNFVRRLRPISQLPGQPAVIIPAHPTKNASDDNLVPYGGGAILNEVDGNLTLAKRAETGNTILHWQGKFRGLEFQPVAFRFEMIASPDVIDNRGRTVQLPVLRPCSVEDVEDRSGQEADIDRAIMRCLIAKAVPSQRDIGEQVGRSKSVVGAKLAKLGREKLVEKILDKWQITSKGRDAIRA